MTNSSGDKGARGERQVQALLRKLLDNPLIRRALGAGRKDDVGDIHNVPLTTLQVTWREQGLVTIIKTKLADLNRQRKNARTPFAALFLRTNKLPWIVIQTPQQWATMHKYAVIGYKVERQKRRRREAVNQSLRADRYLD